MASDNGAPVEHHTHYNDVLGIGRAAEGLAKAINPVTLAVGGLAALFCIGALYEGKTNVARAQVPENVSARVNGKDVPCDKSTRPQAELSDEGLTIMVEGQNYFCPSR